MSQISLPAGYSYQLRGGVQQLNNAFATLGQALILSIILEYMLLVALYESWFYPIVLILGVLDNGVNMSGVPIEVKYILIGAIIVVNTALSQWQRRKGQ